MAGSNDVVIDCSLHTATKASPKPHYLRYNISASVLGSGDSPVVPGIFGEEPLSVAIKIFHHRKESHKKSYNREAAVYKKLIETFPYHPNIVRCHRTSCQIPPSKLKHIQDASSLAHSFLVLERAHDGSLAQLLEANAYVSYTLGHAVGWAYQMADALSYMHEQQLVHHDLKPGNILVFKAGLCVKLCDFGLAVDHTSHPDPTHVPAAGTCFYMAPETWRMSSRDNTPNMSRRFSSRTSQVDTPVTPSTTNRLAAPGSVSNFGKVDVYAWAICFWEFLARKSPYEADSVAPGTETIMWRVLEGARPPTLKDWPRPISRLIRAGWAHSPDMRPSMQQVLDIMTLIRRGVPDPPKSVRELPVVPPALACGEASSFVAAHASKEIEEITAQLRRRTDRLQQRLTEEKVLCRQLEQDNHALRLQQKEYEDLYNSTHPS